MVRVPLVLALLFAPASLLAQSMVTHMSDGSTHSVALAGVAHLRFTSSMTITMKDASTASYALADIRTLTFDATQTSVLHDEKGVRGVGAGLAASVTPNPFASSTTIRFSSDQASAAQIALFDARGKLVRRLAPSDARPGEHALVWDARDDRGDLLPPGSYVAFVVCGNRSVTTKMVMFSR